VGSNLVAEAPSIDTEVLAVKVSKYSPDYPELIENLNCCENYCRWDQKKIIDSNNKYSYGGLMFQMTTFLHYGHEGGILPEWVDETNFENYIYDKDLQTLIAEYMITIGVAKTTVGWYNCWRSYNLSQYL